MVLAKIGFYKVIVCAFVVCTTMKTYAEEISQWRVPHKENLLEMRIPQGVVVIELAPQFAPEHVNNIKTLVAEKYFDGTAIIRSQDNYVVQWGDPNSDSEQEKTLGKAKKELAPEFFRQIKDVNYTPIVSNDAYTKEVGFVDGFPVASDGQKVWLAHCYGAVGVARGSEPNSGNGSGLYVVSGHVPRHLDLNVTLVGRVIQGMELLSSLPRGTSELGFYTSPEQYINISSISVPNTTPKISIMNTDSIAFMEHVSNRTTRKDPWFLEPTGKIELCNVGVPQKQS